jgi:hypothetical protein
MDSRWRRMTENCGERRIGKENRRRELGWKGNWE